MLLEKKAPLISVIVPIYNVEQYLERCVETILNQTYTNLEIILVNDGALDNSPQICDAYAMKDKRIKVIHKKNGGLSDARNTGILHSTGEYLSFIDSDDYIDTKLYEQFILRLNECSDELDLYIFNVSREKEQGWIDCNTVKDVYYTQSKRDVLEKFFLFTGVDAYACNKIYRKQLFYSIQFPVGKLYEDIFTIPQIVDSCNNTICIDPYIGYFYFLNNTSIVRSRFTVKQLDNIYQRFLLKSFIVEKYPDLYDLALNKVVDGFLSTGYKLSISNRDSIFFESKREIENMINKYFLEILKNSHISIIKKIALGLFYLNSSIFAFCYKLYLKK